MGAVIARPWLDRCILYFLERWFFPLSRLWGAARAAQGDVDAFIAHVPLSQPSPRQREKIHGLLLEFERSRLKAFSTEQLWNSYFFGRESVAGERLPIVEEMRLDFRTAYNMTRRSFTPLRRLVLTSAFMDPPAPEEIAARFGPAGEGVEALFALPEAFPDVEVSRNLPTTAGHDHWIRFSSPALTQNDIAYARVHCPEGVVDPPTLIFGHGICVEFDHYKQLLDEVTVLVSRGIRVIRPEAPWHGRRVLPGHYGGEQIMARTPNSVFDFLAAQHQEWATIIRWARETSHGPVAIGGSSLGAQSAKAIAVRAKAWPENLRPDALLLITHSPHLYDGALKGSLSNVWHMGDALHARGWHQDSVQTWMAKLDPPGRPCMPGAAIVSVVGKRDTVTDSSQVDRQLDSWDVPEANRYRYERGHFTVPLGMLNDETAVNHFADILSGEVWPPGGVLKASAGAG